MLVVKYTKKYPMSAISHIDLLRVFQRIIRRAELKVEFSQGFNPHMRLFFSPPMPLGIDSDCEYVTIETNQKADQAFLQKFNSICSDGIIATQMWNVVKNPNFAKNIDRAEYVLTGDGVDAIKIDANICDKDYTIEYIDKAGELQTQCVGDLVFECKHDGKDTIKAVLAFGNKNLRADRFFKYLCNKHGVDFNNCKLQKTHALVSDRFVEDFIDEYVERI